MLDAIREFMDGAGYLDTVAGAVVVTLWLWSKARRHRMSDFIRHYVVGNDRPPLAIGLTRGVVAAGLSGIVQAVIVLLPIPDGQKVELIGALAPTVTFLGYLLFGFLDQRLKGGKE